MKEGAFRGERCNEHLYYQGHFCYYLLAIGDLNLASYFFVPILMKSTTNQYELTFILGEKATQEDGVAKTTAVKDLIKKFEGSVSKEELWGRRELAYEIKRNRSGFYVTLWFEIPPKNLKAFEQELNFDESVIRFLVTKAYTTAQAGTLYPVVEEEKAERAPRGDRAAKEETVSAEETLRRSSKSEAKKEKTEDTSDDLPEGERLEKLDEALEELLKDDEK